MSVRLIKGGVEVPLKLKEKLDPYVREGYNTYLCNKSSGVRYKVLKYCPSSGEMKLLCADGLVIKSKLRPSVEDQYTLAREKLL